MVLEKRKGIENWEREKKRVAELYGGRK